MVKNIIIGILSLTVLYLLYLLKMWNVLRMIGGSAGIFLIVTAILIYVIGGAATRAFRGK